MIELTDALFMYFDLVHCSLCFDGLLLCNIILEDIVMFELAQNRIERRHYSRVNDCRFQVEAVLVGGCRCSNRLMMYLTRRYSK